MSEQTRDDEQTGGSSGGASDAKQSGDPGRTPDQAEGDEQTVDESLRQKGQG